LFNPGRARVQKKNLENVTSKNRGWGKELLKRKKHQRTQKGGVSGSKRNWKQIGEKNVGKKRFQSQLPQKKKKHHPTKKKKKAQKKKGKKPDRKRKRNQKKVLQGCQQKKGTKKGGKGKFSPKKKRLNWRTSWKKKRGQEKGPANNLKGTIRRHKSPKNPKGIGKKKLKTKKNEPSKGTKGRTEEKKRKVSKPNKKKKGVKRGLKKRTS